MFEQMLLPAGHTHQGRNTVLVFLAQMLVVAFVVVMIPLIFTAQLPRIELATELIAPPLPAPPPPPPPPAAAYKAPKTPATARMIVPRRFVPPELIAPKTIPQLPVMVASAPPALSSSPGGVLGGVTGGIPGGSLGGTLGGQIGSIAPPVPIAPPAKTASAPATIRVGGKVQAARLTHEVQPVYPAIARQARVSGTVRLSATIAPNGTVEDLHVVSGNPLLVDAAVNAVKQWTYKPTYLNGKAVQVLTDVDVKFMLG
jgi:periplasmic protein TonB